jgi:hypothetical protein
MFKISSSFQTQFFDSLFSTFLPFTSFDGISVDSYKNRYLYFVPQDGSDSLSFLVSNFSQPNSFTVTVVDPSKYYGVQRESDDTSNPPPKRTSSSVFAS